jgi:hypothetical protein
MLLENDPLIQELAQATEPVNPIPESQPKTETKAEIPPPAIPPDEDFEPELNPEPEFTTGPTEPEERKSIRAVAKTYAKWFSHGLKLLAKFIYPAKLLKEGDPETIGTFKEALAAQPPRKQDDFFNQSLEENPELGFALRRMERVQSLIDESPLTEEEMEILIDPLVGVIQKYQWMQVGPEAELVIALFLIMTPRIEPLFPGVMGMIDKKMKEAM